MCVWKVCIVKAVVFPVVVYGCESWTIKKAECQKNWCFWTVVLETLESLLDCKEIQPVNPKGNQSWLFIGRTDAEAETPIICPPDAKNWLIWKDLDAGKKWKQEEKGTTEDEMVGWHHWLNGHEFEQALGVDDGLACCRSWGCKELDTSEWLNWLNKVSRNSGYICCRKEINRKKKKGNKDRVKLFLWYLYILKRKAEPTLSYEKQWP